MHRASSSGFGLEVVHLPIPAPGDGFEAAFDAVAGDVACAVVEPLVQCAGGFRFHDAPALARMRAACDRHAALLVFDEIATGFYRTGPRFALLGAGVVPDVVVHREGVLDGR